MMNAEQLVQMLISEEYRIATAESCTGGMVASAIVGVPDASQVLEVSFVTYTEEAKQRYAGVSGETLEAYGVVSEEVALEMANGVAKRSGAQVGVASTGVAGPTGGTEEIPVGTVCFGVSIQDRTYSRTNHFPDMERSEVQQAATEALISWVGELLAEEAEARRRLVEEEKRRLEELERKNNKEIRAMKRVEGTWQIENNGAGFYQWLIEYRGLENVECLKFVSSVYLMEKYATEHQLGNGKIFDTERYNAQGTLRALLENEEFIAYDQKENERFQTAAALLRQYLQIEKSIVSKDPLIDAVVANNQRNEYRTVENNASSFYEWLGRNIEDSAICLKYVSSIYSMEKYAEEKRMTSMRIYGVDKYCAESTLRLLLNNEDFLEYDEENDKRFTKAATLLMNYLGIKR